MDRTANIIFFILFVICAIGNAACAVFEPLTSFTVVNALLSAWSALMAYGVFRIIRSKP